MATSKAESVAKQIGDLVGAGKAVEVETVDFSDPNRPKTCLEVDFPILPVNQIAIIEGNAGKPIYQMSKWWARRRSSVFRSMLLAGAMKAPDDPALAAKAVWDVYYGNHQKRGKFAHLQVADIFMGGGTTIVEGSRLGMQMHGVDLNPVAWFIVRNELARVNKEEVEGLLKEIEAEVKPQIMPFYACDCPRGHKGEWTDTRTPKKALDKSFDPTAVPPEERKHYSYKGPEIIYVFWAKHGPCQVTGCGHRTPILSSPVVAVKTLTVTAWENYRCRACKKTYDVESGDARMAPGVPLVMAEGEPVVAILRPNGSLFCPHCQHEEMLPALPDKRLKRKVALTLLVHPSWMKGAPGQDSKKRPFGGSATDDPESTARWNSERARTLRLVEVRGELPAEVTCPETGETFSTETGTVPKKSHFACGSCGKNQDVLDSIRPTKKTGPVAVYTIQGYCSVCDAAKAPYGGRFFAAATTTAAVDAASVEWHRRSEEDLKPYWPRSELPYGFMTHLNNGGLPNHGFTHWWTMFNPRQLLVQSLLLRAITKAGGNRYEWPVREFVLGAFQQYLRNQNMFSIWDVSYDKLAPMLSNNNFHPKATFVENCVYGALGRGNWLSCVDGLTESAQWQQSPWELVSETGVRAISPILADLVSGKSHHVACHDPVLPVNDLKVGSASELTWMKSGSLDMVITDPPFGGLLHYSELSDFFHVWLRLVLKERYPGEFGPEYVPKALECVANRARNPEGPDAFYRELLTACWKESHRVLKPGGILAFTFHHSEDEPWIDVLESLFSAGFYLEATYPIRSDETKGEGAKPGTFGSQTIEYDIIHVCRKRLEEPKPISWGKLRKQILDEVTRLQALLAHHTSEGLASGDLQVVKRGKALEFYSRHYGKVFLTNQEGAAPLVVREALLGIIQLLQDEDVGETDSQPPPEATPLVRLFLRVFGGADKVARDQMQKFLRGTGSAPEDLVKPGWCKLEKKEYQALSPAMVATSQSAKTGLPKDELQQALFCIGACLPESGIDLSRRLHKAVLHPSLLPVLGWYELKAQDKGTRAAATKARVLIEKAKADKVVEQASLGFE